MFSDLVVLVKKEIKIFSRHLMFEYHIGMATMNEEKKIRRIHVLSFWAFSPATAIDKWLVHAKKNPPWDKEVWEHKDGVWYVGELKVPVVIFETTDPLVWMFNPSMGMWRVLHAWLSGFLWGSILSVILWNMF